MIGIIAELAAAIRNNLMKILLVQEKVEGVLLPGSGQVGQILDDSMIDDHMLYDAIEYEGGV